MPIRIFGLAIGCCNHEVLWPVEIDSYLVEAVAGLRASGQLSASCEDIHLGNILRWCSYLGRAYRPLMYIYIYSSGGPTPPYVYIYIYIYI